MIEYIACGIAALVALPYATLPLLIKSTLTMAAEPVFQEMEISALPPTTRDFIQSRIPPLEALGFELRTVLACPSAGNNIRNYVAIMTEDSSQTLAVVTVIAAVVEGKDGDHAFYVEFTNRFANEEYVSTMNSDELGAFPVMKGSTVLQVPQIKDEARLLSLHRAGVKEFSANKVSEFQQIQDWPLYLQMQINKQFHRVAQKTGLLELDSVTNNFRPTLYGAYVMTWGQIPPFKQIRASMLKAKAKRIEARFANAM
ncbi:MAG: hypothetical protein K2W95_22715 [Candidatus Obscuribacterales bacterium]|nr:hypothetical protein [Candidatus Obscuribacterales bacterium]